VFQALNGFLLILTCEGEVFFATHSIESYLGFHQVRLYAGSYCTRTKIFWEFNRKILHVAFFKCVGEEDEMGGAYSTNGEKRNAYRSLVGKPEGRRPLRSPKRRWLDNIRMDLVEV
jgi:hypothetical protein